MNDNNRPLVDYDADREPSIHDYPATRDGANDYNAAHDAWIVRRSPHTFANANNAWGECRVCGESLVANRAHADDGTALADILDAMDRGARRDEVARATADAARRVPEWIRRAREARDRFGIVAVHELA